MTHQPQYDAHQFQNHGRFLKNSGLSFNDFERMHVQRAGDTQPERRLPTPEWALRDELTQLVLVVYLEERFYTTRHRTGTLLQRLAQCRAAANAYLPGKRETLEGWIKDYRTICAAGFAELSDEEAQAKFAGLSENGGQAALTPEIARGALKAKKLLDLERQISNLDTDVWLGERGYAETVAAIIYLYYRMNWNSPSVAEHLSLRPPHIRQVLFRLNQSAASLHLSQVAEDIGGQSEKDGIPRPEGRNHEERPPDPASNLEPLFNLPCPA
jgi:hypothetical protein